MRVLVCSMLVAALVLLGGHVVLAQPGAKTAVFADRTSVYEGQPFNVSVFYYDTTTSQWCPLPGAEVRVDDKVFITDARGRVSIALYEQGSYDMVATKPSFETSERFTVHVMPRKSEEILKGLGRAPHMLEIENASSPNAQRCSEYGTTSAPASAPAFQGISLVIGIMTIALWRRMT